MKKCFHLLAILTLLGCKSPEREKTSGKTLILNDAQLKGLDRLDAVEPAYTADESPDQRLDEIEARRYQILLALPVWEQKIAHLPNPDAVMHVHKRYKAAVKKRDVLAETESKPEELAKLNEYIETVESELPKFAQEFEDAKSDMRKVQELKKEWVALEKERNQIRRLTRR